MLPAADLVPQRCPAQRYAVLGGGERLRPLLIYGTGETLGVAAEKLDGPAAAVEIIHAYPSSTTTCRPWTTTTCVAVGPLDAPRYDEATAILAGDALQVLAFSLLARDRAAGVSPKRAEMDPILADASGTAAISRRRPWICSRGRRTWICRNSRPCTG